MTPWFRPGATEPASAGDSTTRHRRLRSGSGDGLHFGTIALQRQVVFVWLVLGALLVYTLGRWRDGLAQTDRVGLRQCDLAAPAAVRLNSTVGMQGDPSFSVLVLYDALTGDRFRYVLERPPTAVPSGRRRPCARRGGGRGTSGETATRFREIAWYSHERSSSERLDRGHRVTHRGRSSRSAS